MTITASDVSNVISQIYLYSVQDIQQNVSSLQEISIDCSGQAESTCIECQTKTKAAFIKNNTPIPDNIIKDINDLCRGVCECNIQNIDLNEIISVNMTTNLYNKTDEELSSQIISLLNAKQQQEDGTMNIPSTANTQLSSVKKINDFLKNTTFQDAVSSLSASQVISMKGAGNISNVNMNSSITFVSNILQTSDEASSIINTLVAELIASTSQVTESGLIAVIMWIIRIVVVAVFIIAIGATIYLSFQIDAKLSS